MYCNQCPKRDQCIEICPALKKYLKNDIEVSRRERLDCEIDSNVEDIIETEYPEGEIELSTKDWIYLIKNNTLTKLQRKYIYLYYWKRLSYYQIGQKYKVSKQSVTAVVKRAKSKLAISLIKRLSFY